MSHTTVEGRRSHRTGGGVGRALDRRRCSAPNVARGGGVDDARVSTELEQEKNFVPTCGTHYQSHIKNCVHGKASSHCPSCVLWAGPLMSLGPVMLALGTLGALAVLVPPRMHMERRTNLNTQSPFVVPNFQILSL